LAVEGDSEDAFLDEDRSGDEEVYRTLDALVVGRNLVVVDPFPLDVRKTLAEEDPCVDDAVHSACAEVRTHEEVVDVRNPDTDVVDHIQDTLDQEAYPLLLPNHPLEDM
jgi:hypothetical protein